MADKESRFTNAIPLNPHKRKEADYMKYSIVYSSKTGNTKSLAEHLKSVFPGNDYLYFGEVSEEALNADIIFAGFWTDKGTCDTDFKKFLQSCDSKKIFLFGTAGFGGSNEYFDKILSSVKENIPSSCKISGEFMCQGKMPVSVRNRYESMEETAQKHILIANFDAAASHPDSNDFANLENAALKAYNQN